MVDELPDELNYTTSPEFNMAIMRAMGEIRFMEKMRLLMPMVAKELTDAGVDFSTAKFSKVESGVVDI